MYVRKYFLLKIISNNWGHNSTTPSRPNLTTHRYVPSLKRDMKFAELSFYTSIERYLYKIYTLKQLFLDHFEHFVKAISKVFLFCIVINFLQNYYLRKTSSLPLLIRQWTKRIPKFMFIAIFICCCLKFTKKKEEKLLKSLHSVSIARQGSCVASACSVA